MVEDDIKERTIKEIENDLKEIMKELEKDTTELKIYIGQTFDFEKNIINEEPKELTLGELQMMSYSAAKCLGAEHDFFYQLFDCFKNSIIAHLTIQKQKNQRTKVELISLINQMQVLLITKQKPKKKD